MPLGHLRLRTAFGIAAFVAVLALPALADQTATDAPAGNAISDYFAHWFDRVKEAQASQPRWMTPLVTVTPRLERRSHS